MKAHNDEALRTFSQYIVSYARTQEETLPDACILPVSRIAYPSLKVGLSSIPENSSQVPQVGGTLVGLHSKVLCFQYLKALRFIQDLQVGGSHNEVLCFQSLKAL